MLYTYISLYIQGVPKKCIHMLRDVIYVLLMCNVYTFFWHPLLSFLAPSVYIYLFIYLFIYLHKALT